LGANPGIIMEGPRKGLQVLEEEDTLGIELYKQLTEAQRTEATIATEVPKDVFSEEKRKIEPLEAKGVTVANLADDQRATVKRIIAEFVQRYRPELAEADMAAIEASGWEKIQFAWIGTAEVAKPHYYRVQGPTFLFEYDNVQNDARHPHAVWREFNGDFGRDVLAEHYKQPH
jgi:hypothetical protein